MPDIPAATLPSTNKTAVHVSAVQKILITAAAGICNSTACRHSTLSLYRGYPAEWKWLCTKHQMPPCGIQAALGSEPHACRICVCVLQRHRATLNMTRFQYHADRSRHNSNVAVNRQGHPHKHQAALVHKCTVQLQDEPNRSRASAPAAINTAQQEGSEQGGSNHALQYMT